MKQISFLIISVLLMLSCNGIKNNPDPEQIKEPMIGANRKMVSKESADIEAYIRTRQLEMQRTGTGLRYTILRDGTGEHPKEGNSVKVNFVVSLLDGTVCYNSSELGSEIFIVDHDHVESGLHEGIKLMKKGGKAKFILPSHLAHGLLGDRAKIPPMAAVVYDLELLEIN